MLLCVQGKLAGSTLRYLAVAFSKQGSALCRACTYTSCGYHLRNALPTCLPACLAAVLSRCVSVLCCRVAALPSLPLTSHLGRAACRTCQVRVCGVVWGWAWAWGRGLGRVAGAPHMLWAASLAQMVKLNIAATVCHRQTSSTDQCVRWRCHGMHLPTCLRTAMAFAPLTLMLLLCHVAPLPTHRTCR